MNMIRSYPKVYALGHAALKDLLDGPVVVEEKIDGSQFSFAKINGEIFCRSRNQPIVLDAAGMFGAAVKTVCVLAPILHEGWTYRAEYLQKPKHNVLAYDRVPAEHLIIYDVETSDSTFMDPTAKAGEARRIGLEVVPLIGTSVPDMDSLKGILEKVSCLGGQKIEGIVIKNYARFGTDGKVLMGKFVSEAFKEKHKVDWKDANPGAGDFIEVIAQSLRTNARWEKAVQHLKEAGKLEGSPKDIGPLIKEAQRDIMEECGAEIADQLMKYALPKIQRTVVRGLPEWYKETLAKNQFDPK